MYKVSLTALQNNVLHVTYGIKIMQNIWTTNGVLCHPENNISCYEIHGGKTTEYTGMVVAGIAYCWQGEEIWTRLSPLSGEKGSNCVAYTLLTETRPSPKLTLSIEIPFGCHLVFGVLLGSTCSFLSPAYTLNHCE